MPHVSSKVLKGATSQASGPRRRCFDLETYVKPPKQKSSPHMAAHLCRTCSQRCAFLQWTLCAFPLHRPSPFGFDAKVFWIKREFQQQRFVAKLLAPCSRLAVSMCKCVFRLWMTSLVAPVCQLKSARRYGCYSEG
ncbi:hypothetical protein TRVL_09843 [Trypanosoma vivax]|nr:hypothetical protein TRVL_09843 [Trypanosoma vivax]